MDAKQRRNNLLHLLHLAQKPVIGSELASNLGVSRQVVAGDIAILRASGVAIIATPQGYILPVAYQPVIRETIACKHGKLKIVTELEIIVDHGGKVIDVIVEHPVYGEIRANLMLATRFEVAKFMQKLQQCEAEPLSVVTGGVHLHTIEVRSENELVRIKEDLLKQGILLE